MLALSLFAALTAPTTSTAGRLRTRVLRPCSTSVVDFIDHRVLTVRATLLFTTVFTVIAAVLLVALVRMQVHPLIAVEIVAAIGVLAAHVTTKVTGGSAGKTAPAAG